MTPKLTHPFLAKGQAIAYLIQVYRNDLGFVEELDRIRQPYMPVLFDLAKAILSFWVECRKTLAPDEYWTLRDYYLGESQQAPGLPAQLEEQRKQMQQLWGDLQPYALGLSNLAYRWKLRAHWAASVLLYYDIFDMLGAIGLPREIDIPLESLTQVYPWSLPLPPLHIEVPAWAFMFSGRKEIGQEVAANLADYENALKAEGFSEAPHALSAHARWWFEHYVHGRKYDDIAQEEVYKPGGMLISYSKNVGAAIRRFSKLIGIHAETLK